MERFQASISFLEPLVEPQVVVLTLSVPTPSPITMPVPNYILMQGSLADDRLEFASEPRVFDNVRRFNNYTPNALVADISCSLAGIDSQQVDNLGSFTGPVLAISGATLGRDPPPGKIPERER